ncbi:hypothetical protein CBM2585_A90038 [Cupriavidus taiwanensis]|nr:hypothetical protein CBM2585_A90038 [Cupriavidus taiwanensis]
MASRPGDALFASFLSLGQKGGRRLRRRNSSARQAQSRTHQAPPTNNPHHPQRFNEPLPRITHL